MNNRRRTTYRVFLRNVANFNQTSSRLKLKGANTEVLEHFIYMYKLVNNQILDKDDDDDERIPQHTGPYMKKPIIQRKGVIWEVRIRNEIRRLKNEIRMNETLQYKKNHKSEL